VPRTPDREGARPMTRNLWTAAAIALLLAGTVLGGTAAQNCESGKNKEAGKYGYCRQKAEAKFALTGDAAARTAAQTRCGTTYGTKWPVIEIKGGGMCPSSGDQAAIQQYLETATTDVATALAGGTLPDCPSDLATCQTDLTTTQGELTTCQGDLATCQATPQGQPLQTGQTTCYDTAGTVIACAWARGDQRAHARAREISARRRCSSASRFVCTSTTRAAARACAICPPVTPC